MALWVYRQMARVARLNYRAKIALVAFVGTHVPLMALAARYAFQTGASWSEAAWSLCITLAATAAGAAATLFLLDQMLRPVLATSAALKAYHASRTLPSLPTHFGDEAGTLMSDAQSVMTSLDAMLRRLERYDEATGVLNRAGFTEALGGAGDGPRSQTGAVVVVRLTNYDHLVQSLGSTAATQTLRRLVARLVAKLGSNVRLAHVADADLAIHLAAYPEAEETLRYLLLELARPIDLGEVRITPALIAGVAELTREMDVASALDDATAAVATTSEGNPVALHSAGLRTKLRGQFLLEQDLRAAIGNDELTLHFQPIMDLEKGHPVGAEALVRWLSPSRGLVLPGSFIPLAEASGLMKPIGRWVLREACRQVATWEPNLRVAINLGAPQFLDENLASYVAEATNAAGISPRLLEIELTESVATVNHEHTYRTFGVLRDMGVSIAIDDFGTGYASMSMLRKLPFDKLKIDREFVADVHRNPGSQAICDALIALGKGLELSVLAEGAETAEEVSYLASRGCSLFQGYYFSRPVPATALPAAFAALTMTA